MGLWLAVGKVALKIGVPALTKYAKGRLAKKESKALRENHGLEDALHYETLMRAVKREKRESDNAAR